MSARDGTDGDERYDDHSVIIGNADGDEEPEPCNCPIGRTH